jgi:hypothetical protein
MSAEVLNLCAGRNDLGVLSVILPASSCKRFADVNNNCTDSSELVNDRFCAVCKQDCKSQTEVQNTAVAISADR